MSKLSSLAVVVGSMAALAAIPSSVGAESRSVTLAGLGQGTLDAQGLREAVADGSDDAGPPVVPAPATEDPGFSEDPWAIPAAVTLLVLLALGIVIVRRRWWRSDE